MCVDIHQPILLTWFLFRQLRQSMTFNYNFFQRSFMCHFFLNYGWHRRLMAARWGGMTHYVVRSFSFFVFFFKEKEKEKHFVRKRRNWWTTAEPTPFLQTSWLNLSCIQVLILAVCAIDVITLFFFFFFLLLYDPAPSFTVLFPTSLSRVTGRITKQNKKKNGRSNRWVY